MPPPWNLLRCFSLLNCVWIDMLYNKHAINESINQSTNYIVTAIYTFTCGISLTLQKVFLGTFYISRGSFAMCHLSLALFTLIESKASRKSAMSCCQVIMLLSYHEYRCNLFFLPFSRIIDWTEKEICAWKKERNHRGQVMLCQKRDKVESRERKWFSGCKEKEFSNAVPPGIHGVIITM